MKLTVSWWDQKEGIGVALTESGSECLLHRSNISELQARTLRPRMIIHGEPKPIGAGVVLVEKIRLSKNFETVAKFRRLLSEAEL